ncbi:DUF642 domain-containing protein [Nocardioides alcanivorans]|uniref:DUF642 domain-containing protein n=1 Tax=Nocardioides alcanivorans TaxID=2897352 RepID=UPI001F1B5F79|nr:DUF642 domain-containing protein [Nocardioides alcanivorans]
MNSSTRRRLGVIGSACVLLLLGLALPAQADGPNLVTNGDFADPVVTTSQRLSTLPGWTLIDDDAEVISGDFFSVPAGSAAGAQLLDLNTNTNTSIEQSVPTVAGHTYQLTFHMAGNPTRNGVVDGTLSVDRSVVQTLSFDTTGHTRSDLGWVSVNHTFTATSDSTAINFQSTTPGGSGLLLTNIAVVDLDPDGVPMADSSIALLAGGAVVVAAGAGAVVVVRRRQRQLA